MRRVYQNARNVIIWLGASTREIDSLFDWMHHPDPQKLIDHFGRDPWFCHIRLLRSRLQDGLNHNDYREGLQDLLRREWFTRIWVIQEAALARAATITCGRHTINSWAFVGLPKLFEIKCNENVQSRLDIMPGSLREESWWSSFDSQDLGILLQKFGKSKAKDHRDIIYALLGLSTDAFESTALRPNYDIGLTEAIQHTVAYLLNRSENGRQYPDYRSMPRWGVAQLLSALKQDFPHQVHQWISDCEKSFEYKDWDTNIPHPRSATGQKIWDQTVLIKQRRDGIYRASQIKLEMA